jgi:hypothetical protein
LANDDDDINDGTLAGTILSFIINRDFKTLGTAQDEVLESSILAFFENFKHTFLVNDGSSCMKMWSSLCSNSPITKQEDIILIILQRIIYFLKESKSELLVVKSAELFQYLVAGVYTCKILQTSDILAYIETSGIYSLQLTCSYKKSKSIMTLFESIGRLFFSHQYNEYPEKNLNLLLLPICVYFKNVESSGDFQNMDIIIRKLR